MPATPNHPFNGAEPEAVVALGAKPPLAEEVNRGSASDALFQAHKAYVDFGAELEKVADLQHVTPTGRELKRKETAEKALEGLEPLRKMVAKSEQDLAEVTARVEEALADIDPVEIRHWSSYWRGIEGGSAERLTKAREAISDGDHAIALALLRQPKVLALLEDAHRAELRDALAGAIAPKHHERAQQLSREVRHGRQAVDGLERTYRDTIRQVEENTRMGWAS